MSCYTISNNDQWKQYIVSTPSLSFFNRDDQPTLKTIKIEFDLLDSVKNVKANIINSIEHQEMKKVVKSKIDKAKTTGDVIRALNSQTPFRMAIEMVYPERMVSYSMLPIGHINAYYGSLFIRKDKEDEGEFINSALTYYFNCKEADISYSPNLRSFIENNIAIWTTKTTEEIYTLAMFI